MGNACHVKLRLKAYVSGACSVNVDVISSPDILATGGSLGGPRVRDLPFPCLAS